MLLALAYHELSIVNEQVDQLDFCQSWDVVMDFH